MERDLFEEKYQKASPVLDPAFREKVQESDERLGREVKLVVCIEELSELIQVLSKHYRQKEDRLSLIEELGDLLICVESMRQFYGISEQVLQETFNRARQFAAEQQQMSGSILLYIKEIIEIEHILSKCCTESIGQAQMLSTLCSMLMLVNRLYIRYDITEGELNKEINVKKDRGIS